jgi:hypothetical protein
MTVLKSGTRYNLVRSEYIADGIWRDNQIRKNVSEAQMKTFMKKLNGRHQSGRFMYIGEPIRRHNTSDATLAIVLNP